MKLSQINAKKHTAFAAITIAVSLSLSLGTTTAFAAPEVEVKVATPPDATPKATAAKKLATKDAISKDRAKQLSPKGMKSGEEVQTGPGKPGPGPKPPPVIPGNKILKSGSGDLKNNSSKSIPSAPAIDVPKPTQKQPGL